MTFVNIFKDFYSESDSYDNHYDNDRNYTNALIEQSDRCNPLDNTAQKKTAHSDWNEAVSAWKNTVPFPRYVPTSAVSNVIRRQNREVNKVEESDSNVSVKCVGEDFDTFPVPGWKANVEQGTYRYVTNNAYYRTVKILDNRDRREWYTVHKKHPEIVSMHWQNKRHNKEMKRNLRRDLEVKFHNHNRRQQSVVLEKVQDTTSKTPTDNKVENVVENIRVPSVQHEAPKSNREYVSDCKHETNNNSDTLNKASSDLNIDKISSRITVLNEELRRDSKLRKSHEATDISKFLLQTKGRDMSSRNSPSKKKDGQNAAETMTVRSVARRGEMKSDRGELKQLERAELKPMERGELKPVERVTPSQRLIAAESKKSKNNQIRYTNSTGSDAASISVPSIPDNFHIASPDLEKALNSYKMAIETTKQSLFNTLTGNKSQRRTTGGSNKVTHSAPPSVCENNPVSLSEHSPSEGVQSYSSLGGKEKSSNKKHSFSGLLPEIAGKRLEVGTTTNRWL
ncbi:uncharacterized protein LOC133205229 [Saccostrea echinata]|uniref:uncharacterized protein LOC133205229 n=1 Tax=Saccostrea echinata TaxID=191078 RepID=UPI002A834B6B|nr:uncharacterized protein LOC133205229 [Saccostrea echinata]XP_061196977.1 uncharacterized protein LOC133205229 [Saccostrea echinata]